MSEKDSLSILVTGISKGGIDKNNGVIPIETSQGQKIHLILPSNGLLALSKEAWRVLNCINANKTKDGIAPNRHIDAVAPNFERVSVISRYNKTKDRTEALFCCEMEDGRNVFYSIPSHMLKPIIRDLEQVVTDSNKLTDLRVVH